jgi:DNA-binding NtrC family response regulator
MILLVDDEPRLRHFFAVGLREEGYEVAEAGDGFEGWELLSRNRFELVITDVSMPKVDGLTLASWISGRWPSLPVILVSGLLPEGADRVLSKANVHFIEKPLDVDRLVQTVTRLLAARAAAA